MSDYQTDYKRAKAIREALSAECATLLSQGNTLVARNLMDFMASATTEQLLKFAAIVRAH